MMREFLNVLSIAGAAIFMIFFFGLCIFVHELGHFLAAKWRGLKVTAFSIGFRKIWGKTWNGVEYRIGWFPFGGYVEIPQVDGDGKKEGEEEIPPAKPFDRMITVVAGPLFNFIFGFLVAAVIWIVGIPQDTPNLDKIEVAMIQEDSPEYQAGLREGDVIVKLNGQAFNTSWNGFFKEVLTTVGQVTLTVERDGKTFDVSYLPAVNKNVLPDEEIAYPFFRPKLPILVYPEKNSPAEKAGLKSGDKILSVNGKIPGSIGEYEGLIDRSKGEAVSLRIERSGTEIEIDGVIPVPQMVQGAYGVWRAGVTYNPYGEQLEVLKVSENSAAEKAGLKDGDIILTINGAKPVPAEFQKCIQDSNGAVLNLQVKRGETELAVALTANYHKFYTLGVQYAYISHPTPWAQFINAMSLTFKSMRAIGYSLGNTLGLTEQQTTVKAKHMSGPLGIGRILYRSVYDGSLVQGLNIVVLITFSLGLLNLMPFPVLDGGHFVLAILEIIFRKPVPEKYLNPISYAFIAVIIGFMIFVTFYDAKRVIGDFIPKKPPVPVQAPAESQNPGK